MRKKINAPLREEEILSLKAGEQVSLSGTIYTLRDASHRKLIKCLEEKKKLPFNLKGAVIYYCGPTPAPPGKVIGSCGPTTSNRMDPYTPYLLKEGLKGMIGKGDRSEEVRRAIQRYQAVYFLATGGAGAYLSKFVKEAEVILFPELGTEAVFRLRVSDFPLIVGIDARGDTVFSKF